MIPDYSDGKHAFANDRQLQNKLFAADDIFVRKQTTLFYSQVGLKQNNPKDPRFCEVTGWCPDEKLLLRKPENENSLPKPKAAAGPAYLARDRTRKDLSGDSSNFCFYHYPESHRYIEQYRRDHTCTDSTNSASARNEFLELSRFYAYRSQTSALYTTPTQVGYPPQIQYPQKKENGNVIQKATAEITRSGSRTYKLSPSLNVRNEPDVPKDTNDQGDSLQVGANGAGNSSKMTIHATSVRTPVSRQVPSKVTVPIPGSQPSAGSTPTIKQPTNVYRGKTKSSSPKVSSIAAWEGLGTSGAVRTLDTLTCSMASSGEKDRNSQYLFNQMNRKKESLLNFIRHWLDRCEPE